MTYNLHSCKLKHEVVMAYEDNNYTLKELTEKYNINEMLILQWSKLFHSKGIEGLYTSTDWKINRNETKISHIRPEKKYIAVKKLYEADGFSVVLLCRYCCRF